MTSRERWAPLARRREPAIGNPSIAAPWPDREMEAGE